jgi:hypothetical protein
MPFCLSMLCSIPLTYQRVLIAADDALYSGDGTSMEVDKKFTKAIHLLGRFKKDLPFRDPTSDPNINGTVTRVCDKSQSPLKILRALEKNLHSKVKIFICFITSQR